MPSTPTPPHIQLDSASSSSAPTHTLRYGVALTGGIACGKSSLAHLLQQQGFMVICADEIAHLVLEECADIIIQTFGKDIILSPQTFAISQIQRAMPSPSRINRKALGAIVFNNPSKRAQLESITHPHIHAALLREAHKQEQHKRCYFLDIPLFFESGGRARYDVCAIVCISAQESMQLARLQQRDNLNRHDALARIRAQLPLATKIASSDIVIENNASLQHLETQLKHMLTTLARMLPPHALTPSHLA